MSTLKRHKPMNRGKGFQRRVFSMGREQVEAEPQPFTAPAPRVVPLHRGTYAGSTTGVAIAKENASQSQAYQDATRSIGYCMRCGATLIPRTGAAQFCHRDQGKGTGIKTDVRGGWCGCLACHHVVGMSGQLPKELRRATEDYLAWKNRCTLRKRGLWPKSLPDTWRELDAVALPNPEAPA